MLSISYALIPIFGLIVLGQLLKRLDFPGETFWSPAARLTYFVFFPALLTHTVASAKLQNLDLLPMMTALTLAVISVSAVVVLSKPLLPVDNPGFTSLFQGSIRHNTYVGLAAVAILLGDAGLTLAAVALITLIPLVNLLSVVVLMRFSGKTDTSYGHIIKPVLTNPLILACIFGAILNVTHIGLPFVAGDLLGLLGRAALPLGLLVVGAGLDLGLLRYAMVPVLIAAGFKLMVFPVLTATFGLMWELSDNARAVCIIFTALPCAPSAYILAMELGGDARLMAAVLTGQTVMAAVTLPLIILWLT